MKSQVHDFLIIGSGAGGSMAFYNLTRMGFDVHMIEAGDDLSDEYAHRPPSWTLENAYRNGGANLFFGLPPIAFGEGTLLGGTTEINGGLFWDTPSEVLKRWRNDGYLDWVSDKELQESWEELQSILSVSSDKPLPNFDNDSEMMMRGFKHLGIQSVRAQRATQNCLRLNRCAFGCPSGAKQSMSRTLIPAGISMGGTVSVNTRAVSIRKTNEIQRVIALAPSGRIELLGKRVILAAGPNRTPDLVRKSLGKPMLVNSKWFHINAKVWALSTKEVNSQLGTIFTYQMQEKIDEGILMMPSQSGEDAIFLAAASLKNAALKSVVEHWKNIAIFTVQSVAAKPALQISSIFGEVTFHRLGQRDLRRLRHNILLLISALQKGGFHKFLAIQNQKTLLEKGEIASKLAGTGLSDIDLSSVHAMGSLPLNSKHINKYGSLRKRPEVYVMDASGLPGASIESPQGSIMQMAFHLSLKAGKDLANSEGI